MHWESESASSLAPASELVTKNAVPPNQQARFAAMRADPDLAPMFEDIQKNGMAALMKYMNDPEWLAKVGSKAGDVGAMLAGGAGAGGAAAAAPPPPTTGPVVNDIFDACKHNDMEALEDFIAIGKDVNAPDAAGRSPLHYAVAFDNVEIVDELLRSGAVLTSVDGDGNTPLHYAAGYGRKRLIEKLVAAGANGAAENKKGQTPAELVTTEPRNPLHGDAEAVAVLENAALAGAE